MLKKQHQFSAHLTGEARADFRLHMCSLCHALGDQYGHVARLLTSGEMILLNLLTTAQMSSDVPVVLRRCPLNPTHHVRTHQDDASTFAAHIAVSLADVKIADDLHDHPGLRAQIAKRFASQPADHARNAVGSMGFAPTHFADLMAAQTAAEQDHTQDPAQPSAMFTAQLFAQTAHLAGLPQNTEPLAIIGTNYGMYVYLMDAYTDYPRDMLDGTFNPLARFSAKTEGDFQLLPEGQQWLLSRFEAIRAAIQAQLPHLTLYRSETTLHTLLIEPLDKVIAVLHRQIDQQQIWQYRRWKKLDILRAALFILPTAAAAKGLTFVNIHGDLSESLYPAARRRRRGNCTDDCDLYICSTGGHYGSASSDAACIGEGCQGILQMTKCGAGLDGCGDNLDCNGMDSCDGFDCNS